MMSALALVILCFLLVFANIKCGLTLCSSYEYANKIRNILSKQTDYQMYEGKLIFRQNASFELGTNPDGIYGTPWFDTDNLSDPHSVAPHSTYYLRSSSAMIFAGCTPPKSIYFSFASYLYDRFNYFADNEAINGYKFLWASLGASLNNLVWNTTTNMNEITNNYDSLTTVIQTGDNITYNDIYNALLDSDSDISSHEINLQSLPNKYIKWLPYKYNNNNIKQYNDTYDTGSFLLRIAIPENKTEYEKYIHSNQSIFLLEPKNLSHNNTPKQAFEPFERDTYSPDNLNETSVYNNIINEYQNDLIEYFESTYNLTFKKSIEFADIMTMYKNNETDYGFGCIQYNENCGGDNRDTLYWEIHSGINATIIDNHSFYIILGVIHTNTAIKQTLYSNIVFYDSYWNENGNRNVTPSITNFEYNGSGLILPVKTNIKKSYLENIFVVQLTNEHLCINVLPGFCLDNHKGTPWVRNYLNLNTKTRPDITQIVPSILMKFRN